MSKLRSLQALCVFALLLGLAAPAAGQVVVDFPDPNLETVIRYYAGKPSGPIYDTDLAALGGIDGGESAISDLTGLEYCVNLVHLYLDANNIADIGPLAGLTKLEYLDLSGNSIGDISPLAGLTDLFDLDLDGNQIGDISALAGLTRLRYLRLRYNQISDVAPLAGLVGLSDLYLYQNQISDVSPLAVLTQLFALHLSENQISDIGPLASLTNLNWLWLTDNQISDIGPLGSLPYLTYLVLQNNQISDISPLAGCTYLTYLFLDANPLDDISPLAGLGYLYFLWLSETQASDISALAGLIDLGDLDLYRNQITELGPLISNPGIDSGDYVRVRCNPLDDTSISNHIPALEARGVTVDWAPFDPVECPEPTAVASLLAGLATLVGLARRRRGGARGDEAHAAGGHPEDVNGDGFMDLVSHYRTQETGLAIGDTAACAMGETLDGIRIRGRDSVEVFAPRRMRTTP